MNGAYVLSLFAAYFCLVHAAPSIQHSPRAADGPIVSQCTNIELRKDWIVADCLTGEDDSKRIQSASYLNGKIQNDQGVLTWKANGDYSRSCKDCTISGSILSCTCKAPHKWTTPSIDLEEHISVYNGHLLSNLNGRVDPPTSSSKYPIPSDFRIRFGGNTTCPGADGPGTDYCSRQITGCSDSAPTELKDTAWEYEGPVDCVVPVIYFPQYHYQFTVFRMVGEGAWVVEGFEDEECKGEVTSRFEREDMGRCNVVEKPIKALRIRPGFNGDPN